MIAYQILKKSKDYFLCTKIEIFGLHNGHQFFEIKFFGNVNSKK